jgi:hypothetical protein
MRNWYLFRDPTRYLGELLETRGQDDYVVDVECRNMLRVERLRWRLRHPVRAYKALKLLVREAWWKLHRSLEPKKSVAEEIGERMATDPEAAGFTEEGIEALTKAKETV